MAAPNFVGADAPGLAAPVRPGAVAGLASVGAAGAAPAGLSEPHKDETPGLAGHEGFTGQGAADSPDCAQQQHERKAFENLRARLALRGYALQQQAGGALLVIRWNLSRELANLADAERFAAQVGCPA